MMPAVLHTLHLRWAAIDPRTRRRYSIAGVAIAMAAGMAISLWLRAEHTRLSLREGQTVAQLRALQDHLADIERLKGQAAPARLKGPALQGTVVASLQSRGLPLTVTAVDAERLRVQGDADFDEVMRWLGSVQQSQRLGVLSLVATRQDGPARIQLVLTAASE